MKKLNKLLLGAGTVASVVAPAAMAISCGEESEPVIKIMTGFSASGPQNRALQNVVNAWNVHAAKTGQRKAVIVRVEGGYKEISPSLGNAFQAGANHKVPNLVVAYPDTIGVLSSYHKQLDLGEGNHIKDLFSDEFKAINDRIGGIDKGGFYALPFAKSIDMQSINTPVMHHIFGLAVTAGLLTDTEGVLDSWKNGTTKAEADKTEVAAKWGTALKASKTFSASIGSVQNVLEDSEKLLDFIIAIRPHLDVADAEKNKHQYILGIDAATNFIYQSVAQKTNNVEADFLFRKLAGKGNIEYTLKDKTSKAWLAFKAISAKLSAASHIPGGVYFNPGGAYASGLEVKHDIGIAYGSTAGYKYNYVAAPSIPQANAKDIAHANEFTHSASGDKLGQFSKYHNKLYKSTSTKASKYDIKLADASKDTAVAAFITTHEAGANSATNKFFIVETANATDVPDADKIELSTGDHAKSLIYTTFRNGGGESLQENELLVKNTPWQHGASSAKTQLVQGPSLIGINKGAADNAQTRAFVEWVMTSDVMHVKQDHAADLVGRPYEIFGQTAGYIVPTNDVLTGTEKDWVKANPALELTYNTLKDIKDDATMHAFDNPVDVTTGSFRESLQTIVSSQDSTITLTPDEIYAKLAKVLPEVLG